MNRLKPRALVRLLIMVAVSAVVATGAPGLVTSPVGAQETDSPESVVLFIIDLSGSMNEDFDDGRTKLDVAKQAFAEAFSEVPDEAAIGLRVYGDQLPAQAPAARQENCENDTRLAVPIGSGNRDAILQQVNGFEARGDTPIALALQQTAEGDIPDGALANVVLFSDGRDECFDADLDGDPAVGPSWGPDPCVVAEQIAGEGVDLRINKIDTIGFRAEEAEGQLQCIADATGGTHHPVNTPEDVEELPDLLGELGSAREAVRLGGDPIQGTPTPDGAPELERIAPGETNRRYTDTIAMNEERWYRIEGYGPGAGHTTVTFFALPPVEGTTLELRMEPGPEGDIGSGLTESAENLNLRDPSDSVRCGGCHVVGSSETHTLYWVAALRSEDPRASGTFDLELLLEGPAWGGPEPGCREGAECWYEAQIEASEARIAELREELGAGEDLAQLESETEDLEAELASLTDRREALERGPAEQTSWLIPILLGVLTVGFGGLWMAQARRARPQSLATEDAPPSPDVVIGTIDIGQSAAEPASVADGSRREATHETGEPTGEAGREASEAGREVPEAGREVAPAAPEPAAPVPTEGSTPADWYDDPAAPGLLRWWDGTAWTDHIHRKA